MFLSFQAGGLSKPWINYYVVCLATASSKVSSPQSAIWYFLF